MFGIPFGFQYKNFDFSVLLQGATKSSILLNGAAVFDFPQFEQDKIGRVKKKMEEGVEFFLTQPVFTKEDAARLRRIKEETGAKILCGIMPLISRKNAMFMKNEIAGVNVTDEIVARYPEKANRKEGEAAGIQLAKEVMKMVEDFADGYYFSFPFNRVYMLQDIMGK